MQAKRNAIFRSGIKLTVLQIHMATSQSSMTFLGIQVTKYTYIRRSCSLFSSLVFRSKVSLQQTFPSSSSCLLFFRPIVNQLFTMISLYLNRDAWVSSYQPFVLNCAMNWTFALIRIVRWMLVPLQFARASNYSDSCLCGCCVDRYMSNR